MHLPLNNNNQLTNLISRAKSLGITEFPSINTLIYSLAETRKFLQCLPISLSRSNAPRVLRSCVGMSLFAHVNSLHGYSIKCGLLSSLHVNSSLFLTYLEFGENGYARQLFDEMPVRSSSYFDDAIYGFGSSGLHKQVLVVFEQMVAFGFTPCYESVFKAITACGELRMLERGRGVHDFVVGCGLDRNVIICNMLISMYIKMGRLDLAHSTFNGMVNKDLVSWNSLITRYAQTGDWALALDIFLTMKKDGNVAHNNVTLLGVVVACGKGGKLDLGQSIHGHCIRAGLVSDFRLGTAILDMYAKCGKIEYAELLFENKVFEKSLFSWNSLMFGYVKSCYYYKALNCFKELCRDSNLTPDSVTIANIIPAYSCLRNSDGIGSIHALIMKKGIDMIKDVVLGTALIDAYGKCSDVVGAEHLFNVIKVANTPMWNVMFTTYYVNNRVDKGMLLFVQMVRSQIPLDSITIVLLLQMSGKLGSVKMGKMSHGYSVIKGFSAHLKVENCLLDMYMRCKSVEDSEQIFQFMNLKNTVTWNTMLSGYVKTGSFLNALKLFSRMLLDRSHRPDYVTLISLIHTSAVLLSSHGPDVGHAFVTKLGFDHETAVMNSLLDAYMKIGFIHKARYVFVHMGHTRDQWSWNIMITGCGMNGQEEEAFELVTRMSQDGYEPDSVTFTSLLSACAHSGRLDKGCKYFDLMVNKYNIDPDLEHWTCIITMFGRAGRLEEAYKLIKSILCGEFTRVAPSNSHAIWGSFMDACRMYKNIELGELAGRKLLELSPQNNGYPILLSNLYASTMRWDDAMETRQVFCDGSLVKEQALSSIKI